MTIHQRQICFGWCCHLTRQGARLTIRPIFLSINNLRNPILGIQRLPVIKLDIINEVVNRTGITKTKAELAVETVFGA